MSSRYPRFDRTRLVLKPLAERINDLPCGFIRPLDTSPLAVHPHLTTMAGLMLQARKSQQSTLFMLGGHVIRAGVQRYLIDLLEKGLIQGVAVNGSVAIHDYEIALQGATTESVARYIREGQFGLWQETGRINDIIREGAQQGLGFGEALGQAIAESHCPFRHLSLFAAAWRVGVPITVHVGIGYDIIHAHPNFDGAAVGSATYTDFLIFSKLLESLACVCTFGSAVMAPEVFLKALSMVRNVAYHEGRKLAPFSSLVADLQPLPDDISNTASRQNPVYYFRPLKTLLQRTIPKGGHSLYVCGSHEQTIPQLWHAITNQEEKHE